MKPRRTILKILLAAVLLLLLLGLAAVLFPRQVLTVESGPVTADAIVVLGGGVPDRPQRAAELFKAGAAGKIIVSGRGDDLDYKQLLKQNGVPETAILLEGHSRTTFENASFSTPLLRALGARRVIIVTSWYHSRRALACFQHLAPDLQFYSRPAYLDDTVQTPAAEREAQNHYMRLEYPKLLGYWLWHGVCPF